jgi:hypothetical protein
MVKEARTVCIIAVVVTIDVTLQGRPSALVAALHAYIRHELQGSATVDTFFVCDAEG